MGTEPVCAACGRPVRETGVLLSVSSRIVHATCWPGARRAMGEASPTILTGPRSPEADHSESDEATLRLLAELAATPTDLVQLLWRAIRRHASVLVVSADAIRGWEARASGAWAKTRHWLDARGIRLVVLEEEWSRDEPWRNAPAGRMHGPLG